MKYSELGKTGLEVPRIIFGTSCLGNLYQALPWETKRGIISAMFTHVTPTVVMDSAGKYGAGLALEAIGQGLRELEIDSKRILISNKLGWKRIPLTAAEPTFEPGVWADLDYDAEQSISGEGIRTCFDQGRDLLGEGYTTDVVSVHDPDEYLASADSADQRRERFDDVVAAYQTLFDLKRQGLVKAVGVGSKDWTVIRELSAVVDLDWVMFACSLTVKTHPADLLGFMGELHHRGVGMINSAVFNAGFLTGGEFFDYRRLDPNDPEDSALFQWRQGFFEVCTESEVLPARACVQFGLSVPGVVSVALNTSRPERVQQNVEAVEAIVPDSFWRQMKERGLVASDYPYLGQ